MPATFTSKELFDKSTTSEEDMKGLVSLRLKAWAIRSRYYQDGDKWVLETEWNVIGEGD